MGYFVQNKTTFPFLFPTRVSEKISPRREKSFWTINFWPMQKSSVIAVRFFAARENIFFSVIIKKMTSVKGARRQFSASFE